MRLFAPVVFAVVWLSSCASGGGGGGGSGGGGGCCLVPSCSVPVNLQMCGSSQPAAPPAAPAPSPTKAESPPPAGDEALLRRAAFDLDCDTTKVEIVVIDGATRGARGCDKKATYVQRCENGKCEWKPQ